MVNEDHYPTNAAKMAYVISRLEGAAADNLNPYMQAGHPNRIATT